MPSTIYGVAISENLQNLFSGAGILLEGTFQKKGKHIIVDSKGIKVSI